MKTPGAMAEASLVSLVGRSVYGRAAAATYTRTTVTGDDGSSVAEYRSLSGASHVWSGENTEGSFTDASGSEASREMVRFFLLSLR
jgi:hypothetical protein